MVAVLLPNGKQQFIDINGAPLVGGTVGMYRPNTLIYKNTWKDAGATILNTNPIILDSRGQAIIYGIGVYRQIVRDSLGNLIWDEPTTAPAISTDGTLQVPSVAFLRANDFTGYTSLFLAGYYAGSVLGGGNLVLYTASSPADDGSLFFHDSAGNVWARSLGAGELSLTQCGCVGDGTTDDYARMNAAFQLAGQAIIVDPLTFLFNTALSPIKCSMITGYGSELSILKAGTGVVIAMQIGGTTTIPNRLSNFGMTGNATTNGRGIVFGNASLDNYILVDNVAVSSFTGTAAYAVEVSGLVQGVFINLAALSSTNGVLLSAGTGGGAGNPNQIYFIGGSISSNTNYGMNIEFCVGVTISGWLNFNNNGKEGLYIANASTSNILFVTVDDVWFEGNYGNDNTKYQLTCAPSFAATITTLKIKGGYFNGSAGTARAINLTSSNGAIAAFDFDRVNTQDIVGEIFIDPTPTQNFGQIRLPVNLPYNTVTDTGFLATYLDLTNQVRSATVAPVASNGTIATVNFVTIARVTSAGDITGVILQAGTQDGQPITIEQNAAHTITFAASGTSHVAQGTAYIIPALGSARLSWDVTTSLWY